MIGSYGPKLEVQEFESPTDEVPKGLMSLGRYLIRSRVIDDDKNVHLQWEWNLDVKKSWDWSSEIVLTFLSFPPFYPYPPFPGRRVTMSLFFHWFFHMFQTFWVKIFQTLASHSLLYPCAHRYKVKSQEWRPVKSLDPPSHSGYLFIFTTFSIVAT